MYLYLLELEFVLVENIVSCLLSSIRQRRRADKHHHCYTVVPLY